MHSIFRHHHTHTHKHKRARTLARFMLSSLSCLYHSQLAASGQLHSPEHRKKLKGGVGEEGGWVRAKEKKKKKNSTLINQT